LPLIKMQLIPFQEAIAEFAKVMIDDMNNLWNRVVILEKFTTLTPTNSITNEPQPPLITTLLTSLKVPELS
jgi:hypothetical protein